MSKSEAIKAYRVIKGDPMLKITLEGTAAVVEHFLAHEIIRICKEMGYTAVIKDGTVGTTTVIVKRSLPNAR